MAVMNKEKYLYGADNLSLTALMRVLDMEVEDGRLDEAGWVVRYILDNYEDHLDEGVRNG